MPKIITKRKAAPKEESTSPAEAVPVGAPSEEGVHIHVSKIIFNTGVNYRGLDTAHVDELKPGFANGDPQIDTVKVVPLGDGTYAPYAHQHMAKAIQELWEENGREMAFSTVKCSISEDLTPYDAYRLSIMNQELVKPSGVITKALALRKLTTESPIDKDGNKQAPLTLEQAGKLFNKSAPTVSNWLKLLKLPKKVQDRIETGDLSSRHAVVLADLIVGSAENMKDMQAKVEGFMDRAEELAAEEAREVEKTGKKPRSGGKATFTHVRKAMKEAGTKTGTVTVREVKELFNQILSDSTRDGEVVEPELNKFAGTTMRWLEGELKTTTNVVKDLRGALSSYFDRTVGSFLDYVAKNEKDGKAQREYFRVALKKYKKAAEEAEAAAAAEREVEDAEDE